MKCGYVANNLNQVNESEVFMLPGVTASFDACRVAGLTISRIEINEFRYLETHPFRDDLEGAFLDGNSPFYCIFSGSHEPDEALMAFQRHLRVRLVVRLARSLWLLKEGDFYNPLDFVSYRRVGIHHERRPGTFGRYAYELRGYALTEEELPVLEGIYYALACLDQTRSCPPVELAQRLFMHSYDLGLVQDTDRLLILLGIVEALAGKNIGQLSRAAWLTVEQRRLLERFRELRNNLAHGKQTAKTDDFLVLREVIRCLLREAILWAVEDPKTQDPVGERLIKRVVGLKACGAERLAALQTQLPSAPENGD